MRTLILLTILALVGLSTTVPSHHRRAHRVPHKVHTQKSHAEEVKEKLAAAFKPPQSLGKAGDTCDTAECAVSATVILDAMDATADPCDDFYRFACGTYYDTHVPPPSTGVFYEVDDQVTLELYDTLESADSPLDPQPVKDARVHYAACNDLDQMNTVGLGPLWVQLTAPGQGGWPIAMDNYDEADFNLYDALVHIQTIGISPLVGVGIATDFLNTSYNIMYIAEGGLGLSSTYLLDPVTYAAQIGYYTTYIADTAKLVRDYVHSSKTDAEIDAEASAIVNYEIAIANTFTWIPTNREELLEKRDVAYLQTITDAGAPGAFDWLTFFATLFGQNDDAIIESTEPIYIYGEKYYEDFSTLLSTTDATTLANYIGWRFVMETSLATTYAMRNATLKYDNSMYGTTSFGDRRYHCMVQTQFDLKMPTSRGWVDKYWPTAAKDQVGILVELIRDSFQSLLDENTWMAPEDIPVAKEKLTAIIDRVAYPDWIMSNIEMDAAYDGLTILPGEQFNNLMRMAEFFNFWNLESFRSPPVIGWYFPPTIVNAFYDPQTNSITILAGIIEKPFYVAGSIAAVNYGGIGMVIGHEMTHGFDNSGRHFDKDGNWASWWTQESIDGFNNKSQCFVDQYDQYIPPEFAGTEYENVTVDGQSTLGENIADNGGIREAFRAYQNYTLLYGEEPTLPGLESYTPNQLFYLGFANVWCEHKTVESLRSQIDNDPHSPGRFRVIGPLGNDANFWSTWNCPVGTVMNRSPDECVLW